MARRQCRCRCPGGRYTDKWHRWAVLCHKEISSHIKCLECRNHWWSRCRYRLKLPIHVERAQGGLTDQGILERLKDGTLLVCVRTSEVVSVTPNKGRTVLRQRWRDVGDGSGAYYFVTVWHKNRKKDVAVHKLVWMSVHLEVPPPGYDVHHKKNREEVRHPNAYSNLELVPSSYNRGEARFEQEF